MGNGGTRGRAGVRRVRDGGGRRGAAACGEERGGGVMWKKGIKLRIVSPSKING